MVRLDVTRVEGEALLESPEIIQLGEQSMTVVAAGDAAAGLRATRVEAEILVRVVPVMRVTGESLTLVGAGNSSAGLRATRIEAEVLVDAVPNIAITGESLTLVGAGDGSAGLRTTRVEAEVLVRPAPPPPTPIDLPENLTWWLHNWIDIPRLTTSFLTDVARSPQTGSEGRRGLRQKAVRRAQVRLGPVDGKANVDELIRHAKRFVRERMVMPIFADARDLAVDALAADNFLTVSTTLLGRFFQQARIVVLVVNDDNAVDASSQVYTIDHTTPTRIYVDGLLGANFSARNTCIVPLIDVKLSGSSGITYDRRSDLAETSLDVEEISGDSALPTLGMVGGNFHTDGRAIWSFDTNWNEDVRVFYSRELWMDDSGRDSVVQGQAEREVTIHEYNIANDRETVFAVLRFFEAHYGRLRSFWHIDTECLWTVVGWRPSGNPTFLDLAPLNEFDDFVARVEETNFIGIVLADGTRLIREAVTKTSGASWRITVDTALPAGYTAADVKHVAVARISRFDTDAFEEEWEAPVAGRSSFAIREILREANYEL